MFESMSTVVLHAIYFGFLVASSFCSDILVGICTCTSTAVFVLMSPRGVITLPLPITYLLGVYVAYDNWFRTVLYLCTF